MKMDRISKVVVITIFIYFYHKKLVLFKFNVLEIPLNSA